MKSKLFTVSILFVFIATHPIYAQQPSRSREQRVRKTLGERLEKLQPNFDKMKSSMNRPFRQMLSTDITMLNALIPDFQVNENAGSNGADQRTPSISMDASGTFVMVWRDERNGDFDLYAQRYSSDGTALGVNFRVNDDLGSVEQRRPFVSMDSEGGFVVVWEDSRDDWSRDIYAQRYSSDGSPLGVNFRVNDDQEGEPQYSPSVCIDGSDNFIVAWTDGRAFGFDIYAQRYSNDGTPLGSNFKVEDEEESANQGFPAVGADDGGNFVIAWEDSRNGWQDDIYAQRYSSDGTALGTNFKVNDDEGSEDQQEPSVSMDGSGNFVIAWQDARSEWDNDVYAQRYASDGSTLGMNFRVNDDEGNEYQSGPSIATDGSGNILITWEDERSEWDTDIYAQRYSSDGTALGTNFKVNDDFEDEDQSAPSVCTNGTGRFVIAWADDRSVLNSDIYAQRYSSDGTTIGTNFMVNDDQFSSTQEYASICTDRNGNFVVAWEDRRNDEGDIYVQRYSSDGTALGSNLTVNDDEEEYEHQNHPCMCMDGSGNFVIAWEDMRDGGIDLYAQRFSSDGTAIGSNFKVNDDQGDARQFDPSVSVDSDGNFVITWEDERNDWRSDIYAQRYSNDGIAIGTNFKVNDDQGTPEQNNPSVSIDAGGNFVITWVDERNDYDWDIYAQRYSSDGAALGNNFKVNDDEGYAEQWYPSVSTDGSGHFVIAWLDDRDGDYWEFDVYAQRYSSDGTAVGSNFKVNAVQGSVEDATPSVSMDGSGQFVVIWENVQGREHDIYAQCYASNGSAAGGNFKVTNTEKKYPTAPDVWLWNDRIYSAWTDTRAGGTGPDIWANVLDWDQSTGLDQEDLFQAPQVFILRQNYPNPFNPATTIEFSLHQSGDIELVVYDLRGKEVEVLMKGYREAGLHSMVWNAGDLPSGIYLYRLITGEYVETKKLILQR